MLSSYKATTKVVSRKISDDTGSLLAKKCDRILPPSGSKVRQFYQPEDNDIPSVLQLPKAAESLLAGQHVSFASRVDVEFAFNEAQDLESFCKSVIHMMSQITGGWQPLILSPSVGPMVTCRSYDAF